MLFRSWFNHAEEAAYDGAVFEPEDDVLVVGGGLASIDVVKVLMLETTRARLRERGIEVPMVELEVKGIPKLLSAHGLDFESLGLRGCTLFYRRRAEDMPLVEIPQGVEPKRAAKFGLPHFSWLCINPKESEDVALATDVIGIIPKFLDRPNVLGIGEIGLNKNSRNEMKVLEMHVDLAARTNSLILVHTPHLEDKLKGKIGRAHV